MAPIYGIATQLPLPSLAGVSSRGLGPLQGHSLDPVVSSWQANPYQTIVFGAEEVPAEHGTGFIDPFPPSIESTSGGI